MHTQRVYGTSGIHCCCPECLLSRGHPVHLLSRDSTRFTNGVSITSIRMAKGLEFDEVIVPDVDNRNYDSVYDRNLLYIACTRAMHKLTLLYTGSPSPFLPQQTSNDGYR